MRVPRATARRSARRRALASAPALPVPRMSIVLWVLTSLLALAFLAAGGQKVVRDRAAFAADPRMGWMGDFTPPQVKLIGLAEVLGAVGLVAPAALGVRPALSAVAAVCLAALMGGAVVVHVRRGENPTSAAVLALLCLVVAALFRFRS